MSAKNPDSWRQVTRIAWPVAARVLHWSPAQFWAATPVELLGALSNPVTAAPLDREELTTMMERDDG